MAKSASIARESRADQRNVAVPLLSSIASEALQYCTSFFPRQCQVGYGLEKGLCVTTRDWRVGEQQRNTDKGSYAMEGGTRGIRKGGGCRRADRAIDVSKLASAGTATADQ